MNYGVFANVLIGLCWLYAVSRTYNRGRLAGVRDRITINKPTENA